MADLRRPALRNARPEAAGQAQVLNASKVASNWSDRAPGLGHQATSARSQTDRSRMACLGPPGTHRATPQAPGASSRRHFHRTAPRTWPASTCLGSTVCAAKVQAGWTHDDETRHAGRHRPAELPGTGTAIQAPMSTSSGPGLRLGLGLGLLELTFGLSGHRAHLLHRMQIAGKTLQRLHLLGHAHGQQQGVDAVA